MTVAPTLNAPVLSLRDYCGETTQHTHDHAQVMFAFRGRMDLEVGSRAAFADMAVGMVIPAGTRHTFVASADTRMIVVDAPDGVGLDRMRRFSVPAAVRRSAAAAASTVAPAAASSSGTAGPSPQSSSSPSRSPALPGRTLLAANLLAMLLQAPTARDRRSIPVDELNRAIDCALGEDWTVSRMAQAFHLSTPRLHARFVELTGTTPLAHLRQRRLAEALRLLQRGWSLDAVALSVGYRSAPALSHALRRDLGTGARQLRR